MVCLLLPPWDAVDGVLQISMLKRGRKGHYAPGSTNANTWWRSLLTTAGPQERIPLAYPPTG